MASSQATTDRTRDEPTSEKARTIADVAREMGPNASNPSIADEVEARIGDRPDPSWVSRVRSKYVDDHDDGFAPPPDTEVDVDPDGDDVDELMLRVDMLAGRLERYTSHVDAVEDALTDLERRVEAIEDAGGDDLADAFEDVADRLRDD